MEGIERTNAVMMCSQQITGFAQRNPYAMDIDRRERRNCYSCGGFGHLTWNCRRQIMGQGRRMECEDTCNNGQNHLNGERDLIVLN